MSRHHRDSIASRPTSGDVLVGIPAYNEAETVASVVADVREHTPRVLVVDDGSDDQTAERAAAAGATVVSHDENRGYGAALQTIFSEADERDVDHLVIIDADGQHDPADIPDLVATQRSSGADIVIGSRFIGGSQTDTPLYRRVGLAVINVIVGVGLRLGYSTPRIKDTQSGFRTYNAAMVETLANRADLSDGMDASVDVLFHAADESCEFAEVPVDVTYDVVEANTHNPVVHGAVLVRNVSTRVLSDRPVRLLGMPGIVCLLVGAVLGGASITDGSVAETVPELLVTLLIAAGSALAGVALAVERAIPSND